jgi:hypothetical protein
MDILLTRSASRLLVGAALVLGLTSVAGVALLKGQRQSHDPAVGSPTSRIAESAARLTSNLSITQTTSDKARRARAAIKSDDFDTARQIIAEVLKGSKLQNWRFYPFSGFIAEVSNATDTELESHLSTWIAQSSDDPIPLLVRAQYHNDTGWFHRGEVSLQKVRPNNLAASRSDFEKANADINAAIGLDQVNPYAFYLRLRILRGRYAMYEMATAFEEAIVKFPAYYALYDFVLGVLEPKRGGSIEAMYAFVDRFAGQADSHSPLKLLYLSLYRNLLDSAQSACAANWYDKERMAQCVVVAMQGTVRPELGEKILTALQLNDHLDTYEFGLAVEEPLLDMLKIKGGDFYSGAMLELVATAMHSDTQLKPDRPAPNNYIIDKLVSESWYLKGFYENAMAKEQQALRDIESTQFLSQEEKNIAIGAIYEFIAGTHNKLKQYAEMIAYEQAALALGAGQKARQFICYGYYQLQSYDNGLQACSQAIAEQADNMIVRYWRSRTYKELERGDAQLSDATVVAESESDFRSSAALDISMFYFDRNDVRSALVALNNYTYLYDPQLTGKDNVAVGYNNRCYAYMQLGELKQALADCTQSLRYGSLPDAYRKQQKLIERLNAPEARL